MNRDQLEGSLLNQVSVVNEGQVLPIYFGVNQMFILEVKHSGNLDTHMTPLGLANDTELVIEDPEPDQITSIDNDQKPDPEIRTYLSRHLDTCTNPFLQDNHIHLMCEDEFDHLVTYPTTSPNLEESTNWRGSIIPLELVDWQSAMSTEVIVQKSKLSKNSKILLNFRQIDSNLMALNVEANMDRLTKHISNGRRIRKFESQSPRSPGHMSLEIPFKIKNVATGFVVDATPMDVLCKIKLYIYEAMKLGVSHWVSIKDNLTINLGQYSVQLVLDKLSRDCYEEYANLVVVSLKELRNAPILDSIDLTYVPRELVTPISLYKPSFITDELIAASGGKVIKLRCIDDRDIDALTASLRYRLLSDLGMDYICIDLHTYTRRGMLQASRVTVADLMADLSSDLAMRSPVAKIFVMFRHLDVIFKSDVNKDEKHTYAYIAATMKK